MKKPAVALAVGLFALIGFAIWGMSRTQAPEPTPVAAVEPAPPEQPLAPSPEPAPAPSEPKTPPQPSTNPIVMIGERPVAINRLDVRIAPGDIDGAIAVYENSTDPAEKINNLMELAYQPAEEPRIHEVLITELASQDKEMRDAAFETIIAYEDPSMIPKLQEFAEKTDSDLAKEKAEEAIQTLEMPSLREVYKEALRTGKPLVPPKEAPIN